MPYIWGSLSYIHSNCPPPSTSRSPLLTHARAQGTSTALLPSRCSATSFFQASSSTLTVASPREFDRPPSSPLSVAFSTLVVRLLFPRRPPSPLSLSAFCSRVGRLLHPCQMPCPPLLVAYFTPASRLILPRRPPSASPLAVSCSLRWRPLLLFLPRPPTMQI